MHVRLRQLRRGFCTIVLHYKILVVRPSVTEGHLQRKRFDPEKQEAVSLAIERQKLELSNPVAYPEFEEEG